MAALIDWDDVENWGRVGRNVHAASWAPDPKHGDETEED